MAHMMATFEIIAVIIVLIVAAVIVRFALRFLDEMDKAHKCRNCWFSSGRYDDVLNQQGRCWCMRYYLSKDNEGFCDEWKERE